MKTDPKDDLFEFRFHYHFEDSVGFSDKYFLAHDLREAKEMFDYACGKRNLPVLVDKIEKMEPMGGSVGNFEYIQC